MGRGGPRRRLFPEDDMFRGANKVTLDSKGRLAMPTRYRERIVERSNGRLIATVDRADRCLLIYPLPEWEEIELKLRRLPTLNPVARRLQRLMIGHATDLDLDANGRILIPPSLREYAQLNRTAMLIGQGNRFELWDEGQWNENREAWLQVDESAEELPPELGTLSL
jgi:MraZ protein